jgi:uncharacterized protein (DUF305 family)
MTPPPPRRSGRSATARLLAAAACAALVLGCTGGEEEPAAAEGPTIIQPGAPGEPSRTLAPDEVDVSAPMHSEADVRFIQHMIPHHAQALQMTRLVPDRASRDDVKLFAERIEVSQEGEIDQMVQWLEAREEEVPAYDLGEGDQHEGGHGDAHTEHGELMPGMLTPEELDQLEQASGEEFDRLFLELMRRHHMGALEMVAELFASEDGGQDIEVFQIANHIDSDQRIEIDRIDRMLADRAAPPGG